MGDSEDDKKTGWQEALKELGISGLATLLMTEDSIRNLLREKKLPKEMVGVLLDGLLKKKDDLYAVVGKEVGKVFAKVDIGKEVAKFLETHEVEVSAKLKFQRRETALIVSTDEETEDETKG